MKTENFLILDIETMDAPSASILLEQGFAKPHAGTKDLDKKANQVKEKQAKLQESAALLDSSPISIIGTVLDGETYQFVWREIGFEYHNIDGVKLIFCGKTEQALLSAFGMFLERIDPVIFVGHNIEKRYNGTGFDLPHLRFRYAFHGIPLPPCMNPLYMRSLDLMELYFKSSTTKKDVFVSLEEMSLRLGVTDKPFMLSGKDVPALWQQGEIEACLLKNYYDLLLTRQVLSRLTL